MMKLQYHVDKIGIIGSIFSSLCCLGFPAIMSFLTAIGAGFLINDAILLPLLLIFLFISIFGTVLSYGNHRNIYLLIGAVISAVAVYVFLFVVYIKILIYIGLLGMILLSIYSSICIKKCEVKK